MLMIDRITEITEEGGAHEKGRVVAEFDINPKRWFFECHFLGDPVMPGCLGLDGLWQLLGFYLGWLGGQGRGRAIAVGDVKLAAMVQPAAQRLRYVVDIKRVMMRKLVLGVADGIVDVDGERAYTVKDMKVALFQDDAAAPSAAG